jgi:hypothetical protein
VLDLSSGQPWWRILDAYVWADDSGVPGNTIVLLASVDPGPIAVYPQFSRHVIELPDPPCVSGGWWVGYWGAWPGSNAGFWLGADRDGPGGGAPMTKIAPGLEWPSGWQDVAVRWGPTSALGIGADVRECPPSPTETRSWGRVKALYR